MKTTYLAPHIVKKAILACIIGAGILFCNTLYIQVKAVAGQHLISQAWEQTLALHKKANQYEESLSTDREHTATRHKKPTTVKPWEWADTYPVAKMTIPRHRIEHVILAGANGSPLAFAPGLYAGTQLPDTNAIHIADAVIAGHHNTHFSFLADMDYGDAIHIQTHTGNVYAYRVTAIEIYDIRTQRLPSYFNGTTLQLVTCKTQYTGELHPTQRLVITASL